MMGVELIIQILQDPHKTKKFFLTFFIFELILKAFRQFKQLNCDSVVNGIQISIKT